MIFTFSGPDGKPILDKDGNPLPPPQPMLGPDGKPLKGRNGEYIYPPPYGAPLEQGGLPGGAPGGLPTQTPGAAKPREYIVQIEGVEIDFSLE